MVITSSRHTSVGTEINTIIYISALLIEKEPTNMQAQSLSALIEKGVARGMLLLSPPILALTKLSPIEGYIGMALAGGVAAIGTLVLASLIRRATRK
jgi:mitochondrial fission 1 protein